MPHDHAPPPPASRYRRRLAAAAVASVMLHLLLARGLALTSLGRDGPRPEPDRRPRRQSDFTIRVPKSPPARPAHEQPQTIATERPAATRPPARPAERTATDRGSDGPEDPALRPIVAAAAAPAPARDRGDLPSVAAPERAATGAAPAAVAQADTVAAAAAAPTSAAAAPAAAARGRDAAAAVNSRWRPREVALLERLTAPAAARPTVVRDGLDAGLAAAGPAGRPAIDAASGDAAAAAAAAAATPSADASRALVAAPATAARRSARPAVASPSSGKAAPTDRVAPTPTQVAAGSVAASGRREAAAGIVPGAAAPSRQASVVSGPATAADAAAAAAPATATAAVAAPVAPAAGGARRGDAATAPATTAGGRAAAARRAADGEATAAAPSVGRLASLGPPTRDSAAGATAGATAGAAPQTPRRPVSAAVAAGGEAVVPAGDGTAAVADARSAAVAGPRAVGAAAGGSRSAAALGRPGTLAADAADADADGELSVQPAVASSGGGSRRRIDAEPAPAAAALARAAVVALPAEARVRDAAEAFAGRGRAARERRRDDRRAALPDTVVDRGLAFLAAAQQADGRWSLGRFAGSGPADVPGLTSDTAATGLALLAFLGAGHDHFDGPHRATVRRGLEFLLAVQKPDGDLYLPADDLSNSCAWLYSHGIASIALCEAVGMTGDPLVKPAAAKACRFIASSQHPDRGGWRYVPGGDADLSVSGWMLVAVRSGGLAGVETDPRTLAGVRRLLEAAATSDPARYAYNPRKPDQRASESSGLCMTAVGGLMRLHTGAKPDDPRVAAAARELAARRPAYDERSRDCYLWYYASQVLVHTGGPEWDAWYGALVDVLAATQETAGPAAGSWDPLGRRPDRWGRYGGRLYVTALHLLALEVPDRRLPTYTAGE